MIDLFFNKPREAIFLKEDSNLEKQIEELKEIRKKINNDKIDRDIKFLEAGLQGEKEIAFELKHSNIGMYILHDITLEFDNLKSQIDYVIVTQGFIYLVECKNMIGNIIVDEKGEFKREYTYGGKKIVEGIYSPYTQAIRHKELVKKEWMSRHKKLMIALTEKNFDTLWYKPLVVLSNSKSLLNTKYAPKEIKENVIRVDALSNYIRNDLSKYDQSAMSSEKGMLEIAEKFLKMNTNNYTNIAKKYIMKDNIKDNIIQKEESISNTLELKLKKFRKEKSKEMKVPTYYIFNDEEMNKIIEKMPKTINELEKLNILSSIKIKLHAKEIINILNGGQNE